MRDFQQPGRSPALAVNGMVATSQPLATAVGLEILRRGGNAVDAAVAASAVLCVVQPSSTGIGGDCFILYSKASKPGVIAYNGSGRAPRAATVDWYAERKIRTIENHSPHSVTIPGAIDAWAQVLADYGTMGLGELLQPAIGYARDGYPVHARMARDWNNNAHLLKRDPGAARIFLRDGKGPAVGTIHRQPELAESLALIGRDGRDAFYKGPIAEKLVAYLKKLGGLHSLEDFTEARGEYVTPIRTNYHGYDLYECPPNGQGIVALEMLNILSGFGAARGGALSTERMHRLIETAWIAYGDRDKYLCDPAYDQVPVDMLLSSDYADRMRARIDPARGMIAAERPKLPAHNDTIYLAVVDRDGNAISFINSLFASFGSALCEPQTGIMLQNRASGFTLEASHPNCIAPRKRPLHTIIPAMLAKGDKAIMPFGNLGGHYQPVGQVYLLENMFEYGCDVQEAIDLARIYPNPVTLNEVQVENGIPSPTIAALKAMGHNVVAAKDPIGGAQAIWIDWESGVLAAGSEPRYDGCALGY